MLKPYYVELKIGVVVMAENRISAMCNAELIAGEAVRDIDPSADEAIEIDNLEHLHELSGGEWDGDCIPYNAEGETRLRKLLPPNVELTGDRKQAKLAVGRPS